MKIVFCWEEIGMGLDFEGHSRGKNSDVDCVWKQVLTATKKGQIRWYDCTLDVRNLNKNLKLSLPIPPEKIVWKKHSPQKTDKWYGFPPRFLQIFKHPAAGGMESVKKYEKGAMEGDGCFDLEKQIRIWDDLSNWIPETNKPENSRVFFNSWIQWCFRINKNHQLPLLNNWHVFFFPLASENHLQMEMANLSVWITLRFGRAWFSDDFFCEVFFLSEGFWFLHVHKLRRKKQEVGRSPCYTCLKGVARCLLISLTFEREIISKTMNEKSYTH